VPRHASARDCMCCQLFDVIVGNVSICIRNSRIRNALTLGLSGMQVSFDHGTKTLPVDPSILLA